MSYEKRRVLFENLKILVKSEYEEIYRILKRYNQHYTENSNGIFFDMMTISQEAFNDMEKFIDYCLQSRAADANRERELKELKAETDAALAK